MTAPINVVQLVENLPSRSRGKACVVLTHEYKDQITWAAELARLTGSEHIDLLTLFAQNIELCSKISQCFVPNLFDLLRTQSKKPVLIVTGIEFLKATWSGQPNAAEQFASYIETWEKTPSLLFVLQYDKTIATRKFKRFGQYTFVVDQKETLAL